MIDINNIKKLAKYLTQQSNLEKMKYSNFLDLLSKFNGYQNWNSLIAIEEILINKEKIFEYIHIDNGGYFFSYDIKRSKLYIKTTFYGYSESEHSFNYSLRDLKNLIYQLEKASEFYENNEEDCLFYLNKKEQKWHIDCFNIYFHSSTSKIRLMRSEKIIEVLKKLI